MVGAVASRGLEPRRRVESSSMRKRNVSEVGDGDGDDSASEVDGEDDGDEAKQAYTLVCEMTLVLTASGQRLHTRSLPVLPISLSTFFAAGSDARSLHCRVLVFIPPPILISTRVVVFADDLPHS